MPSTLLDLWYLSFVDTSKEYREEDDYPGGPRWMGACIVPGVNELTAVQISHIWGCNPGGEVRIVGPIRSARFSSDYIGRLLSKDELEEAGL